MFANINGINTVIHDATALNFSAYCYDTVVVSTAGNGAPFILNGTTMALPSGTMITLKISSVSASTSGNIFVIGTQINNMLGSPNLP
jgi:hypothetical protein